MQMVKSLAVLTCSMLMAGAAAAQEAADVRGMTPARERGHVAANAGATLETRTTPVFGVEYAEPIGRYAQGYVALTYFDDLTTEASREELRNLGSVLSSLTGSPWEFSARDRGIAFAAGAKFLVPTGTGIRPYVGGGAGAIKITRTITERTRGNLTDAVIREGLTDASFSSVNASATKPMVEGIVGVGIAAGHTYVDVGYRYRKAFHFAAPLDFGQFAVGVGYKF